MVSYYNTGGSEINPQFKTQLGNETKIKHQGS